MQWDVDPGARREEERIEPLGDARVVHDGAHAEKLAEEARGVDDRRAVQACRGALCGAQRALGACARHLECAGRVCAHVQRMACVAELVPERVCPGVMERRRGRDGRVGARDGECTWVCARLARLPKCERIECRGAEAREERRAHERALAVPGVSGRRTMRPCTRASV